VAQLPEAAADADAWIWVDKVWGALEDVLVTLEGVCPLAHGVVDTGLAHLGHEVPPARGSQRILEALCSLLERLHTLWADGGASGGGWTLKGGLEKV